MKRNQPPDWFDLFETEQVTEKTMTRLAASLEAANLPVQTKYSPVQAHWFYLDTIFLANNANREGMHANALAITRQCIEAISIIELGLANTSEAADVLLKWNSDELTPGAIRKWLEANQWPKYGCGLWNETWADFMGSLARAIQPYAHYSQHLAYWQMRLHPHVSEDEEGNTTLIAEYSPRAYDPQKATRITLYHALLNYALARAWIATNTQDHEFTALISRFRLALGRSRYLDGKDTKWEEQFWAMLWLRDGTTVLE